MLCPVRYWDDDGEESIGMCLEDPAPSPTHSSASGAAREAFSSAVPHSRVSPTRTSVMGEVCVCGGLLGGLRAYV
jgi:hypothetical protein